MMGPVGEIRGRLEAGWHPNSDQRSGARERFRGPGTNRDQSWGLQAVTQQGASGPRTVTRLGQGVGGRLCTCHALLGDGKLAQLSWPAADDQESHSSGNSS